MDIYKIIRVGKEFFKKNGPMIAGLVMTGTCFVLRSKFNIPFGAEAFSGINFSSTLSEPFFMRAPENSMEESILALYKTSRGMSSNFHKDDIAEKIENLVRINKDIPDQTRSYAIQALSNIGSSMNSNFYRDCITDRITRITKLEVKE